MRYPTLTRTKTGELAGQLARGQDVAVEPHAEWVGMGEEVELESISDTAAAMTVRAREWTDRDRDRFEGKAAAALSRALCDVPVHVLDDRGFWRFLSLAYFWEFITWREEEAFAKGNHLKYVDASTSTESVLPRMYLRAEAVGGRDHADLMAAIPDATDFWRSHVIRVRSGTAPAITRAFVRKQAESRLMTDSLRQAARRLNRTWANVVLTVYDDDEAAEVVSTVWEQGAND